MKKQIKNAVNNAYWVFILAVWATIEMIKDVITTIKNYEIMLVKDLPVFQIDFWMNAIQIVTVIVIFVILKKYKKAKKEVDAKIKLINAYIHFLKPNAGAGYLSAFLSDEEMELLEFSKDDINAAAKTRKYAKEALKDGRI